MCSRKDEDFKVISGKVRYFSTVGYMMVSWQVHGEEMADQQQMKTSFLFIQLKSPSKSAQCSQKACSLAEGSFLTASRKACDTRGPDSCVREDTQLKIEAGSSAQKRVSCRNICTAMSNGTKSSPSTTQAYTLAKSREKTFTHDQGEGECHKNEAYTSTDPVTNKYASNSCTYPSDSYVSSCWNVMDPLPSPGEDKMWWKVEVHKPSLTNSPILRRSPECKSFRDAVVEKSAALTGLNDRSVGSRLEGQMLATKYTMSVTTASPVILEKVSLSLVVSIHKWFMYVHQTKNLTKGKTF